MMSVSWFNYIRYFALFFIFVLQAPSAALCLSIMDLYSNSKAASGLLLKFCNDLSQSLQEENKEVDVGIVAG